MSKGRPKSLLCFGFDSKFCPSIICASSSGNRADLAIVAYILVLGVAKGAVFSWKEARFYQDENLNWPLAVLVNAGNNDSSLLCLVYNGERYY